MENERREMISPRQAAVAAAIAIFLMSLSAFFSAGYVQGSLVISGDAVETFERLTANKMLFRVGLMGWLVILICDVVAAWALYLFFVPVNKGLSLLSAWLRLIYTGIFAVGIANLIQVMLFLEEGVDVSIFPIVHVHRQIRVAIYSFEQVWNYGLILFGFHLLILGILTLKKSEVPKIIGILLLVASASYIVIHAAYFLFPDAADRIAMLETILSIPMMSEILFAVWLIVRGGRLQKTDTA